MSRDTLATTNKIALLATGDEIINGDILNSNAQIIAQKLFSAGMQPGLHMAVSDHIDQIELTMNFLLKNHRALIITGGLGPTSDDLTRYALSKVINRPLVFHEEVWHAICERFKLLGYKGEPPESNRQQALFPEGSVLISNPSGTAAGCYLQTPEQLIFMLPGPPFECLPMIDNTVLPLLKKSGFQKILYFQSWLLFGIGESMIADELDKIAKPYDCMTGYRLAFPYIEFKLYSSNQKDFETLLPLIKNAIAPYLISHGNQTASAELRKELEKINFVVKVNDLATHGLLESTLATPKNNSHLTFSSDNSADIIIRGLKEYWNGEDTELTHLEILFTKNNKKIEKKIPYRGRGERVKFYAMEFICAEINSFINVIASRR